LPELCQAILFAGSNRFQTVQLYVEICNDMQKYAIFMQRNITTPPVWILSENMQKHAQYVQLYAKYVGMIFKCKICTPHFADE
jgi:hypothetical protein